MCFNSLLFLCSLLLQFPTGYLWTDGTSRTKRRARGQRATWKSMYEYLSDCVRRTLWLMRSFFTPMLHRQHWSHTCLCTFCTSEGLKVMTSRHQGRAEKPPGSRFPFWPVKWDAHLLPLLEMSYRLFFCTAALLNSRFWLVRSLFIFFNSSSIVGDLSESEMLYWSLRGKLVMLQLLTF